MGNELDPEQRRTNLSAAKQALLERRLRGDFRRDSVRDGIPRRAPGSAAPLSFSQRRLWFLDRLEPGSKAYNIPLCRRIEGPLDVEALRRSLTTIRARHEILRTSYVLEGGEARQQVLAADEIPFLLADLSGLPQPERERAWRAQAEAASERPFDLARGEVIRAHLWRLGPEDHILLVSQHHIGFDAWSSTILYRELASLYEAFHQGRPSPLAELPLQYADFAAWQQQALNGAALDTLGRYWKERLAGAPPVLELPMDRPRPAAQRHQGKVIDFQVPKGLGSQLKALAQEEGVTLFMLLAAAFNVLLYRYSHQEDILIGTPSAGRSRSELESLIGFFVNTLVLRTSLEGDPTFLDLLERVKEASLGMFANVDMPFERLVEDLAPTRDQSISPLFQVMFLLQNTPREELRLAGLTLRPVDIQIGVAKFDLTLGMCESGELLEGWFEYNTDLFDPSTIERMIGHWQQLLWGIAANPRQNISQLQMLQVEERRQLLVEWNATTRAHPASGGLHELFEAAASTTPEAVAVSAQGAEITYRELDARSNQLAHLLRRRGVGPGGLVALCLEGSIDMVVAMLATLKAGAAYVPVDPDYPAQRIALMLEDAQPAVVVSHGAVVSRLPAETPSDRVLALDGVGDALAAEASTRPGLACDPESCAYVIYTSGSTGRPKGAMIPHRAITNHMHWMQRAYPVGPGDVVFQKTPFSFDASVWEFYAPLLAGARLHIARPGGHRDPAYLSETVRSLRVTVLQVVPSLLRLLLEEPGFASCGSLKRVFCGGEPLTPDLVRRFTEVLPRVTLHNLYGPTETAIDATAWDCTAADGSGTSVPIGRPVDNAQCYILDHQRQPVPMGVPGELWIGGRGVGLGYWRRPDLTAERFQPDPFSTLPGVKAYRTGDLCRYRPGGVIEFLGRLDHQVKVRGYRIELGEIEAILNSHPSVQQSVVVVREYRPSDRRIVAYAELKAGAVGEVGDLRSHVRRLLPDHMVPSAFMIVRALPLTPNGKVDRKRLPAPDPGSEGVKGVFTPPVDPVEIQIARIWERLLDVPQVGLNDNFFTLGGHSLLAVHLFVEIEKSLGKNLPLASLFIAPTVAELARLVREGGGRVTWSSLVPIQPKGTKPPFFCIHAAGGNVLFYRDLALRLGEDQPFYGLQPKGLDGSSERHRTIEEMAAHYLSEIRSVQPRGPYYLGGSSYGGLVAWEMACQLLDAGETVGLLAMFDTHGPGYPEFLPGISNLRFRIQTYRQVFQHHWATFWMLPGSQRWAYMTGKGSKLGLRMRRIFRRRVKRMGHAVYRLMGRSIPQSLQATQDLIMLAGSRYTPRRFRGVATVFRASEQPYGIKPDPALGWDKVAAGPLEVIEIPGYHGTMVVEPRVALLADKLRPMLGRIPPPTQGH